LLLLLLLSFDSEDKEEESMLLFVLAEGNLKTTNKVTDKKISAMQRFR
jgi:hypothetical protein